MTEKKYLDYPGLQAYDTELKNYTATSENNGMMSSTDKDKLDALKVPVAMTQAEYDALTEEEKNDGTIRFITDGAIEYNGELYKVVSSEFVASEEESTTASKNYSAGDLFFYNEVLYKVTDPNGLIIGDTIVIGDAGEGTNVEPTTIADEIKLLYAEVTTSSAGLMSSEDKSKLNGIAAGAEVNVQSDWTQSNSNADDYIKNKPTLGSAALVDTSSTPTENGTTVLTTGGAYTALNGKVDKVNGKGLSTNDLTDALKQEYDAAYTHSQTSHARADATKVEASETNGNIVINGNETTVYTHPSGTNPHGTTASDLGLSNVENKSSATIRGELTSSDVISALGYTPINSTTKGSNSGLAELDANGKVPASQLPSFVDDVIEGYLNTTDGKFYEEDTYTTEITPEAGKIYTDLNTDSVYRWGGSAYANIGSSLALGETSTTAYRGDRGKTAYDHSQSLHARTDATKTEASETNGNVKINGAEVTVYTHPGSGTNPHSTTAADVDLGNVVNTGDSATPVENGTTKFTTGGAYTELAKKQDNMQVTTMPTAGADYLGKAYQYLGQTNENYIHGFFYECREVSSENYAWETLNTAAIYYSEQPNDAGGTTVIISTTPSTA